MMSKTAAVALLAGLTSARQIYMPTNDPSQIKF